MLRTQSMLGRTGSVMYLPAAGTQPVSVRRKSKTVAPIMRLQKAQFDEVASHTLALLSPRMDELLEDFKDYPLGMRENDFVKTMLDKLYSDTVSQDTYYQTKGQSTAHITFLFQEACSGLDRVQLDELMGYLEAAHWRMVQRREQRTKSAWFLSFASDNIEDPIYRTQMSKFARLNNLVSASAHTYGGKGKAGKARRLVFAIHSDRHETSIEIVDAATLDQEVAMIEQLTACVVKHTNVEHEGVTAIPTMIEVLGDLGWLLLGTTANIGSHLFLADLNTGAVKHCVSVDSHQTVATYDSGSGKIITGSSLGDVIMWTPPPSPGSEETGGTQLTVSGMCRAHNGSIVKMCAMPVHEYIVSAGVDGMLCLVDPHTSQLIRSIKATNRTLSVADFDPSANLLAVSCSDRSIQLWQGSLPLGIPPIELMNEGHPHEYVIAALSWDVPRSHLLSLDVKGNMTVWDGRTARALQSIPSPAMVLEFKLSTWKSLLRLSSNEIVCISDQTHHRFQLRSKADSSQVTTQIDSMPIVSMRTTAQSSVIMAASKANLRVFNTGSGLQQLALTNLPRSRITACAIDGETGSIIVGEHNGDVVCFDASQGGEHWRHEGRHNGDVLFVECGGGVVFSAGLDAKICASRGDHSTFTIERLGISVVAAFYFDVYELFGVSAVGGKLELYETTPLGHTAPGGGILVEAHSYDISGAVANAAEGVSTIAFLGSIGYAAVAEDDKIVILSLSTTKTVRLLSWRVAPVDLVEPKINFASFADANNQLVVAFTAGIAPADESVTEHSLRPELVEREAPQQVVTYNLTDVMQEVYSVAGTEKVIEQGRAPNHLARISPFPHSTLISLLHLKRLNVFCAAADSLECFVYRLDGVKMGQVDMFRADSASWKAIALGNAIGDTFEQSMSASVATGLPSPSMSPTTVPIGRRKSSVGFGLGGHGPGGGNEETMVRRSTIKSVSELLEQRRRSSGFGLANFGGDPLAMTKVRDAPKCKHNTRFTHGAIGQPIQAKRRGQGLHDGGGVTNVSSNSDHHGILKSPIFEGRDPELGPIAGLHPEKLVTATVAITPGMKIKPSDIVNHEEQLGKPAYVRPKAGEASNRTEKAIANTSAKWTQDYVPPLQRGDNVVVAVRMMTRALSPSPQVVGDFQHQSDARWETSMKLYAKPSPVKEPSTHLVSLGKPVLKKERLRAIQRQHASTPSPTPTSLPPVTTKAREKVPDWMAQKASLDRIVPGGGGFRMRSPSPTV